MPSFFVKTNRRILLYSFPINSSLRGIIRGSRHLRRVRADIDVRLLFGGWWVARYERRSKTEIKFSCLVQSWLSKHDQKRKKNNLLPNIYVDTSQTKYYRLVHAFPKNGSRAFELNRQNRVRSSRANKIAFALSLSYNLFIFYLYDYLSIRRLNAWERKYVRAIKKPSRKLRDMSIQPSLDNRFRSDRCTWDTWFRVRKCGWKMTYKLCSKRVESRRTVTLHARNALRTRALASPRRLCRNIAGRWPH